MGFTKHLTGGADLTRPKASVHWVVGAVVAVAILALAVGVGMWLYGKAKRTVSGVTGGMSGNLEGQAVQGQGTGWL